MRHAELTSVNRTTGIVNYVLWVFTIYKVVYVALRPLTIQILTIYMGVHSRPTKLTRLVCSEVPM